MVSPAETSLSPLQIWCLIFLLIFVFYFQISGKIKSDLAEFWWVCTSYFIVHHQLSFLSIMAPPSLEYQVISLGDYRNENQYNLCPPCSELEKQHTLISQVVLTVGEILFILWNRLKIPMAESLKIAFPLLYLVLFHWNLGERWYSICYHTVIKGLVQELATGDILTLCW
jgi:hypothetical protein